MTELIKTNQELTLNRDDHPLLKRSIFHEVKGEVFAAVAASIARCYADLNQRNPDNNMKDYMANELTDNIISRFPQLRIAEIPIAFANGIRGKYGEYFGLSVISFEQFIAGYLDSEDRMKLMDERNRLLLEVKTEKTPDEIFSLQKISCLEIVQRPEKTFNLMAPGVYDFLNSLGLIDKDYKEGIMKEALDQLLKEKNSEAGLCLDRDRRKKLKAYIDELNTSISNDAIDKSSEQYREWLRIAKRICMINWFRDMVTNETDLSGLIEAKRAHFIQNFKKPQV